MIDMHSHIIPKIDDGSESIEESYIMFEEAKKAGFTDIIATSHYMENYYETDSIKIHSWIVEMNEILKNKNIDLRLHPGTEIYVSQNIVELIKNKKAATLADSRYILFELPMNNNIKYLDEIIFEIQSAGLIPIIAHPERYIYIQKNPNMLIELINKGVLFQANYASIMGYYGDSVKSTLKKLLESKAIHFFGSDSHKKNSIYSNMEKIMIELEKIISKEKIKELTIVNPEHVLKDNEFKIEEPEIIKKGFIDFFRK